ncbi:Atlastin-1 [Halotydeus destructor]|nr:Atlastin-1 [Halotydeus destructor]
MTQTNGHAVQIIQINDKTKDFELDSKALEAILTGSACRDRPVSIVSIAGATRKGKSFMLNLLLRYLQTNGSDHWLGAPESPLHGFSWRSGSRRDTTGILLWSQPAVIALPDGREVAVLLMDTQGAFDGLHTVAETAAIFAISTLTSSVQIYNIFNNVQEDDLQNLEMFSEYGRLALKSSAAKPFQKLLFLVRDWQYPQERSYGLEGGNKYLDSKLEVNEARTGELARVRNYLRAVFSNLECFLMPHPGMTVARTMEFDGRLQDIDSSFVTHLKALVPYILHKDNIIVKRINDQDVTGLELVEYFKAYFKCFTSGEIMKPESIMAVTAQANNQAALAKARDFYLVKLGEVFNETTPSMSDVDFNVKQTQCANEAINMFNSQKKMGGEKFSQGYLEKLKSQLDDAAKEYRTINYFKREIEDNLVRQRALDDQIDVLNSRYDELEKVRDEEIKHNTALGKALEYYDNKNTETFGNNRGLVDATLLYQKHVQLLNEAIQVFNQAGGPSSGPLFQKLESELERTYQQNKAQNDLELALEQQKAREDALNHHIQSLVSQQGQLKSQIDATMQQLRLAQKKKKRRGFFNKVVPGEPVPIVSYDEKTETMQLHTAALRSILASQCGDKPVVLISIGGATRTGKSFLMNFFMKYLNAQFSEDWLKDVDEPLSGFSWWNGAEKETTGILLWSHAFVFSHQGEDVCFLFMDTEGTCNEKQQDMERAAVLFAFSALVSSVQIFNVFQDLTERDFQSLDFITEYGNLLQQIAGKPQLGRLLFLVRDWQSSETFELGYKGGLMFLRNRLDVQDGEPQHNSKTLGNIKTSFCIIDCFLMPSPGLKAQDSEKFDGKIRDIDQRFVAELDSLIDTLFDHDNVVVKTVSGQTMNGSMLADYFVELFKHFSGDTLPQPWLLYEATRDIEGRLAVKQALQKYRQESEKVFLGLSHFCDPKLMSDAQDELVKGAYSILRCQDPKYGAQLLQQMAEMFKNYELENYKRASNLILELKKVSMMSKEDINLLSLSTEMKLVEEAAKTYRQRPLEVTMGHPVQIVSYDENSKKYRLDSDALDAILLGPQCKDKSICLVSIVGATRKGKSFLMNYLVRYLHLCKQGEPHLLGNPDDPLKGFHWRGGSEGDTSGILLWSDPFVLKSKGQDVCVLLMDTQGAFDGQQAVAETAAIFALSALTSSVQIFNVSHNLQENDFQNLEFFSEYGRLVLEQSKLTPFQKLIFLIRDWPFAEEFPYGFVGGRNFLETKLAVDQSHGEEAKRIRRNLENCYTHTYCFLMTHPGMEASTGLWFDGRLSDLDVEFVAQVETFAKSLFDGDDLVLKNISGQPVHGAKLAEYFKEYVKVFAGDSLPDTTSLLQATANVNNREAVDLAVEEYRNQSAIVFSDTVEFMVPATLAQRQHEVVCRAMSLFDSVSKVGGAAITQPFKIELQKRIDEIFRSYEKKNEFKGKILEQRRSEEQRRRGVEAAALRKQELDRKIARDKQNGDAKDHALHHVSSNMNSAFLNAGPLDSSVVNNTHVQLMKEAIAIFDRMCVPGGGPEVEYYRHEFVAPANATHAHFTIVNNQRIALRDQQAREEQLRVEAVQRENALEAQRQEQRRIAEEEATRQRVAAIAAAIRAHHDLTRHLMNMNRFHRPF